MARLSVDLHEVFTKLLSDSVTRVFRVAVGLHGF